MPKYTQRIYELVAAKIKAQVEREDANMREIADSFAATFEDDNPAFKKDLFYKACGL